ncbi:MAG: hypothetical protein V3V01_10625 [Acidimicrobiales bacterium]
MKFFNRFRPSPAMLVAVVALFFAMGGSAVAQALIGSEDVIDNSLTGQDIKNNSIRSKDVKGLKGSDIRNGSLSGKDIKDGTVLDADIDSVAGAKVDGQVENAATLDGLTPDAFEGAIRWAVVAADGTILDQSGDIVMHSESANGNYYLDLGESQDGKAVVASVRDVGQARSNRCGSAIFVGPGFQNDPTESICTPDPGALFASVGDNYIYVQTRSADGSVNEVHAFYVAVFG